MDSRAEVESLVRQLESELAARPDDQELRLRLAMALRRRVEESLSVTVHDVRVVTTAEQQRICRDAAVRIPELAPHDELLKVFAADLLDDVRDGEAWVWDCLPIAAVLAVCVVSAGLIVVAIGAAAGSIALVVGAALLSSAALAAVVLRFRRQWWQVVAGELRPLLR